MRSKRKSSLFALCLLLLGTSLAACQRTAHRVPLKFRVTLAREVADQPTGGRLFIFMSNSSQETESLAVGFIPESTPGAIWMSAMEVTNFAPGQTLEFNPNLQAYPQPFSRAKPGAYQVMALLDTDHSFAYGGQNAGDLCSPVLKLPDLTPPNSGAVALTLNRRTVSGLDVAETDTIKLVEFQSQLLSGFWKRPIKMRAGIVLPPSYHKSPGRNYAALYRIHGFGADHTAAWQEAPALSQAMIEGKAPELTHVFLDASFPTGHHVFVDSANNGPWGRALVEEFIPQLEHRFHLIARSETRFLTGHSSGGWSTLWLQIAYPDFFGGTWSTAPDPVDFRHFLGIDLTPGSHHNAYRTRDGKPRNLARIGGEERVSIEEFARQEAIKGDVGGQLASFEWAWSPKGVDGRPMKLFDRATGELDPLVQQAWQQYDIRATLEEKWARLGPKLRGKIHVIVGGEDNFHLEAPVAQLCDFLKQKGSRAVCEIVPGRDHDNLYDPHQSYPDGLAARINKEIATRRTATYPY